MKILLFLCFISGLVAICMAGNCKPLTKKQISYLASKGINVPDDYCHISGLGIYKLHEDVQTWNNARKICNDEGGRLAIINSKDEADAFKEMFENADMETGHAFLGFHDFYNEGEFVTILGQPLEETGYNTWSEKWGGQPDNGGDQESEQCGAFDKNGKLDDLRCSWRHGYFCQIPLTKKYF